MPHRVAAPSSHHHCLIVSANFEQLGAKARQDLVIVGIEATKPFAHSGEDHLVSVAG